jgi:hypothetical protein
MDPAIRTGVVGFEDIPSQKAMFVADEYSS